MSVITTASAVALAALPFLGATWAVQAVALEAMAALPSRVSSVKETQAVPVEALASTTLAVVAALRRLAPMQRHPTLVAVALAALARRAASQAAVSRVAVVVAEGLEGPLRGQPVQVGPVVVALEDIERLAATVPRRIVAAAAAALDGALTT